MRSPFLSGSFEGSLISSSDESVSGAVPATLTLLRFFLGGDRLVSSSEEDDSSIRLFRRGFFMVGLYDAKKMRNLSLPLRSLMPLSFQGRLLLSFTCAKGSGSKRDLD